MSISVCDAGRVAALTSSRAHHSVGRHAGGGHCRICCLLSGLLQERALLCLDRGVDIDSGVVRLGLGDIVAAARSGAEGCAGEVGCWVPPRGNAERLSRNRGGDARHVGDDSVVVMSKPVRVVI